MPSVDCSCSCGNKPYQPSYPSYQPTLTTTLLTLHINLPYQHNISTQHINPLYLYYSVGTTYQRTPSIPFWHPLSHYHTLSTHPLTPTRTPFPPPSLTPCPPPLPS